MYELIKNLPYWLQISIILIPIISLFIAAGAFAINVRQSMLQNKLTRANLVANSLHIFMDDETMHKAFYNIEYGRFKYSNKFHGSEEEKEIDKLLRHFSNIALMWENNLLELEDIQPIQYFILRTTNNSEITKYLSFIDKWSENAGTGSHPYSSLSKLRDNLNKMNLK